MESLEHASNVDLLSTLTGKPAAQVLMEEYGALTKLAQVSFTDLQQVKGVGKSRAAAIKSAFLLAQRLSNETIPESPLMDQPEMVAALLRERNRLYTVEVLQLVLVNTRRRLLAVQNISHGTLDTILVHAREVFAAAIAHRASAIILAHNHPSGDPTPSEADIKVTRDLVRAGQLLNINVLDHIILGQATTERPKDFLSLRELGYLSL
jgi:DNA repair protein RadC